MFHRTCEEKKSKAGFLCCTTAQEDLGGVHSVQRQLSCLSMSHWSWRVKSNSKFWPFATGSKHSWWFWCGRQSTWLLKAGQVSQAQKSQPNMSYFEALPNTFTIFQMCFPEQESPRLNLDQTWNTYWTNRTQFHDPTSTNKQHQKTWIKRTSKINNIYKLYKHIEHIDDSRGLAMVTHSPATSLTSEFTSPASKYDAQWYTSWDFVQVFWEKSKCNKTIVETTRLKSKSKIISFVRCFSFSSYTCLFAWTAAKRKGLNPTSVKGPMGRRTVGNGPVIGGLPSARLMNSGGECCVSRDFS